MTAYDEPEPYDRNTFRSALAELLAGGRPPLDAVRTAAAVGGLCAEGDVDAVARLAVAIARKFGREHGHPLWSDAPALARIADASAVAVRELRHVGHAEMNLPFLAAGRAGPIHLTETLTRAKMNAILEGHEHEHEHGGPAEHEHVARRHRGEPRARAHRGRRRRGIWIAVVPIALGLAVVAGVVLYLFVLRAHVAAFAR